MASKRKSARRLGLKEDRGPVNVARRLLIGDFKVNTDRHPTKCGVNIRELPYPTERPKTGERFPDAVGGKFCEPKTFHGLGSVRC